MSNSILISRRLVEAIQTFQWEGIGIQGLLVGPSGERSTVLAVWQNDISDIHNIGKNIDECLTHFPCGKTVTGVVQIAQESVSSSLEAGDCAGLESDLTHLFGSVDALLEQFDRDSLVVLYLYKVKSEQEWKSTFVLATKSSIKLLKVQSDSDGNSGVGMRMRLKADIPLVLSASTEDAEDWSRQLKGECTKLQKSLEAGSFVFGFDGNKALIHKEGSLGSGYKNWKQVKDLRKYLNDAAEQREEKLSAVGKGIQIPIDVSLLQLGTDQNNCPGHAPIIAHKKGSFLSLQMRLPIDVLIEVKDDLTVSKLYTMLTKSVSRQISAFFKCLETYRELDKFYAPEVFHLKPSCLDTPVSLIYAKGIEEEKLKNVRLSYHYRFLMAKDRPYLRKACAGIFLGPTAPGGYIVNPHIGLNVPACVKNGKLAVVEGFYSYHHYMQDRFNDDKWGCAYRSLQTIISWFKYQGYTNKSIPSHKEIQQALCDCGDKTAKFVGSRQWIGSFEVSFVLDHLLGVSSKFINVSTGAELSTTGQQLMNHFQTQGTPVMIGGGVLAHTILGVAYDELTGDIAFLILDPHYTGGEDLKLIQDKGWCGWKEMKFWDQTAHYNMCLPQRPVVF